MVSDPQGAHFTLFRHFGDQEAPQVAPGTLGFARWHELRTSDRVATFSFYSGLFGWTKDHQFDIGGRFGIYQIFAVGGEAVGGMMNSMDTSIRPHWLYYFNVGDIDSAATRVSEAGGQVLNGPHQVPTGNWVLQSRDPQGAAFALVGSRA